MARSKKLLANLRTDNSKGYKPTTYEPYVFPEVVSTTIDLFPKKGKISFSLVGNNNQRQTFFGDILITNEHAYITQPFNFHIAIVVDVDNQSREKIMECLYRDENLMPNEIVANREKEGAHLIYWLETPFVIKSRGKTSDKMLRFYKDAREKLMWALYSIGLEVDMNYSKNGMFKNPLNTLKYITTVHTTIRRSFNDIVNVCDDYYDSHQSFERVRMEQFEVNKSSQSLFHKLKFHTDNYFYKHVHQTVNNFIKDNNLYNQTLDAVEPKVIDFLQDKFTIASIAAFFKDNEEFYEASKDKGLSYKFMAHIKWLRDHFIKAYNLQFREDFLNKQRTASVKSIFYDYARDNDGKSKHLITGTYQRFATQLEKNYTDLCSENRISQTYASVYKKILKNEFGAIFPTANQFRKMDKQQQQRLKQHNRAAYASWIGSKFVQYFPFMKNVFLINWFKFVDMVKSMIPIMNDKMKAKVEDILKNYDKNNARNNLNRLINKFESETKAFNMSIPLETIKKFVHMDFNSCDFETAVAMVQASTIYSKV